ncbi:MAG: UDP-N-acetylmuramoyl-tripeptide--D-alanyl-D-alanine ligase [Actinomycetota bacterium]|nr:UDP-N-acetylmuramoyl-tripeptide--D-alanyl-D-alanine ligase [Actinomycetota bacterium]
MRPRRLSGVARAVNGRLIGEDAEVDAVVVDSRTAGPGTLFVAIRGERQDGHRFVAGAFANGAAGALVERAEGAAGPAVVVADAGEALLDLAADERTALAATVVGITGSTGKTCTKDFAAAVLRGHFDVLASPASFNNEVGLPLTLLSALDGTEVVVCEMGARGVGHVARLCQVARPSVGIVTNVGVAHLELFGSRENIVRAKAELVEALPPDGVAVLNADDPVVRGYAARTPARAVTFGLAENADVRAEDVTLGEEGRAAFTLVASGVRQHVELAVAGAHMVPNALAASACGLALGVTLAECAAALKDAHVSAWRMETFTTEGGVRVVNDAYNANPASMQAALQSLRWMARPPSRAVAVLGHMAELGPISDQEHERVGELVARLGIDRVVTVGPQARAIAVSAQREGVEPENVAAFEDARTALAELRTWLRPGDVVLVKGSRVAGLEKLAEALRDPGSRP